MLYKKIESAIVVLSAVNAAWKGKQRRTCTSRGPLQQHQQHEGGLGESKELSP